jgi:disulfide bond formation protein DsbB
MGYNDYDQPDPIGLRDPNSMIQTVISAIVRIVGVVILFVGLWVGLKVILEAWALYDSPERIERFAVAVERGSNLDKIFSATVERMSTQVIAESPADEPRLSAGTSSEPETPVPALRLSYFAAWFIVMMLMLIVGSLAMSAISAGGKLALYDTEVRKYSREVVREFARLRRAA